MGVTFAFILQKCKHYFSTIPNSLALFIATVFTDSAVFVATLPVKKELNKKLQRNLKMSKDDQHAHVRLYSLLKLSVRFKQVIDGSARKPALRQDTGYMVEKNYHMAPYLGAFEAYLLPQ